MKTLPYERFDDVVTFNCEVNRSTAILATDLINYIGDLT